MSLAEGDWTSLDFSSNRCEVKKAQKTIMTWKTESLHISSRPHADDLLMSRVDIQLTNWAAGAAAGAAGSLTDLEQCV